MILIKYKFELFKSRKNLNSLIFYTIIALLPIIVFSPILENSFSFKAADDDWMLIHNPSVYNLNWETIVHYFTTFYYGQYSPLNTFMYSIIYQVWGINPFAYHLFSLIFHAFNSILVFIFINKLLNQSKQNVIGVKNYNKVIAFMTATLFSIHPMQVESVAWISASKIIFSTTFFLLAIITYLKYVNQNKTLYYWMSFTIFIISFGFKEQVVVLPICLLLIDFMIERNSNLGKIIKEKILFFVTAFLLGIVEIIAQNSAFEEALNNDYYELYQRLILACYSIIQYITKILIPFDLNYWYPFPMKPGTDLPVKYWIYPLFITLIPIYFITWIKKPNKRIIIFGALFFLQILY